jgi:predicted Zn-dependent protease
MGLKAAAALLLGNSGGLSDMAGGLGLELLSLSYSRSQENEADLEGLMLLARARVSSDGLIEFFETLASHDVPALTLLSTHPMSAERAQRMRDARKAMAAYTPEPFAIDWAAVKAGL